MAFCDECVTLFNALAHVFLVKATRQLEKVVGVVLLALGRICRGHRRSRGLGESRNNFGRGGRRNRSQAGWCTTVALKFADSRFASNDSLAQLFIFLIQPTQLDDDLVKEVVDLVLIVTFTEFGRLKTLVDYVFWSQSHVCHLQEVCGTPIQRTANGIKIVGKVRPRHPRIFAAIPHSTRGVWKCGQIP